MAKITESDVLEAARGKFGDRKTLILRPVYEHGQWWLMFDDISLNADDDGAWKTYSVVGTSNGIDFEEV